MPVPLDNAPPPEVEITSLKSDDPAWRGGETYIGTVEAEYRTRSEVPSEVETALFVLLDGSLGFQMVSAGGFQRVGPAFETRKVPWDTIRISFEEDALLQVRSWRFVEGKRTSPRRPRRAAPTSRARPAEAGAGRLHVRPSPGGLEPILGLRRLFGPAAAAEALGEPVE